MSENNTDSGASAVSKKNNVSITDPDHDRLMSLAHKRGLIEGIKMFAWYKDGVQYVGTTGTTLKQALAEIDSEYGQKKPGISMKA